jgi:hypothetical protein
MPTLLPPNHQRLIEMHIIDSADDVAFARPRFIKHAYVVFDHHYYAALEVLKPFFREHGISPGRPLRRLELLVDGRRIAICREAARAAKGTAMSPNPADKFQSRAHRAQDAGRGTLRAPPQPRVSIVIPVYNEEAILHAAVVDLIDRLRDKPWSYEIILTENGVHRSHGGDRASSDRALQSCSLSEYQRAQLRQSPQRRDFTSGRGNHYLR